jgi:hypothetical protein
VKILRISIPLFTIAMVFASGAVAGTVQIKGNQSESSIKSHCDKAGGVFFGSGGGDGGYGCTAAGGSISCNKSGECSGECSTCGKPAVAHKGPNTIFGVLSGSTLKTGTNAPAKPTEKPVHIKQPLANSGAVTEHRGKKK